MQADLAPRPESDEGPGKAGKQLVDSAGVEQALLFQELHGDPAQWHWSKPLALACLLTRAHLGYWLVVAVILGVTGMIPLVSLLVWPFGALMVIGATSDLMHGIGPPSFPGTWRRWSHRAGAVLINFVMIMAAFMFAYIFPAVLLMSVVAVAAAAELPILMALGFPVGIGATFLLFLAVSHVAIFSMQAAVLESLDPLEIWKHSFRLLRRNYLGILGISMAIGGSMSLVWMVIGGGFMVFSALLLHVAMILGGAAKILPPLVLLAGFPLLFVVMGLLMSWTGIAWTFLYLRERALLAHQEQISGAAELPA